MGREATEQIVEARGLRIADLEGSKYWISVAQCEGILAAVREIVDDDDAFKTACTYRMRESYGFMAYLVRAATTQAVLTMAVKTMPRASRVSRYEILNSSLTHVHCRYRTDVPEGRLMCLSRQAHVASLPTLWGLPEGSIEERACVAQGDPYCEYVTRWRDHTRFMPSAYGAVFGGLAGFGLLLLGVSGVPLMVAGPLLGGALGHILEQRRVNRTNLGFVEESAEELRALATEHAETMEQLFDLHQREQKWGRLLEEQVTARTETIHSLLEQLQDLGQKRVVTMRSFSHDLRNPLMVIQVAAWELRNGNTGAEMQRELLVEIDQAIDRMERMLTRLMQSATASSALVNVIPKRLPVDPLADQLKRRLAAMVYGRSIRVSAFRTREAPDEIETDELIFDRVVDNLLTNAAKYTDQGSIVVEVSGTPGMLTIKVSDTGRGISHERIERVLQAGEERKVKDAKRSYGMGLSVVVRLMDHIGGRLEIMSRPGVGTTFWAHFPVQITLKAQEQAGEKLGDIIGRVVRIRSIQ